MDEYRLAVTDSTGKVLVDFDNRLDKDYWSYYNWQSNETIRAVMLPTDSDKTLPKLYNPFTKEYRPLRTDWPDVYIGGGLDWKLDWLAVSTMYYEGSNIVYDPSLTRVVYPKNGEIVSLTDVETGKELASHHLSGWGKLPRWSPNGKKLVLIASASADSTKASDEFFIVSKDGGEFKRLTYLTNTFEQVAISEYAWSPDGEQIAFLLNTASGNPTVEGTQSELAILDVKTGEITSLCFQAISAVTHLGGPVLFAHLQPVWSPSGTQVMVAQWDADSSEAEKKYGVWVVDLPSLTAVQIDHDKQPAGWMIEIP
jgi:dipeptidyl aminopeptidase/acylaminoacyl peptidase